MNTVTLMVTMYFPGEEPNEDERSTMEENVLQCLTVGHEDGAFNGCSHFSVEVENAD